MDIVRFQLDERCHVWKLYGAVLMWKFWELYIVIWSEKCHAVDRLNNMFLFDDSTKKKKTNLQLEEILFRIVCIANNLEFSEVDFLFIQQFEMCEKEAFNKWLNNKLKSLNTDETVFGSYILGILEGDESKDEKREALDGILSAIIVS